MHVRPIIFAVDKQMWYVLQHLDAVNAVWIIAVQLLQDAALAVPGQQYCLLPDTLVLSRSG